MRSVTTTFNKFSAISVVNFTNLFLIVCKFPEDVTAFQRTRLGSAFLFLVIFFLFCIRVVESKPSTRQLYCTSNYPIVSYRVTYENIGGLGSPTGSASD